MQRHDTFSVLFAGFGYEPTICKYRRGASWDELRSIICDAWGPARFNYECKGMALPVNSHGTFVQFLERSDRGEVESVAPSSRRNGNGNNSNHSSGDYHPVLRCMLIAQQERRADGTEITTANSNNFGYLNQDQSFGQNVGGGSNNNNNESNDDQHQQEQQQAAALSSPLRTFHNTPSGAGVLRPSKPKSGEENASRSAAVITRVRDYSSSTGVGDSSSQQQQQQQTTNNNNNSTSTINSNAIRPSSAVFRTTNTANNQSKTTFRSVPQYNNDGEEDENNNNSDDPPPNEEELNGTQRGEDVVAAGGSNNNSTHHQQQTKALWRKEEEKKVNEDSLVIAIRTEVPPVCTQVRVDQGGLIGNLRNHIRNMAMKNAKTDLPHNFLLSFTRPDCESNIDVEDDGDFNFLKASIKKLGPEAIVLFADVSKTSDSNVTVNADRTISNVASPLKRNPFAPHSSKRGSPGRDPMEEASKHLL